MEGHKRKSPLPLSFFVVAHFTTAQVFEFTFQAKVGWKFESRWEAQNFPCCQHFLKISYDLGITKV